MGQSIIIACPLGWKLADFSECLADCAPENGASLYESEKEVQLHSDDLEWKVLVDEMSDRKEIVEDYESNDDLDPRFRIVVRTLKFVNVRFGGNFSIVRDFVKIVCEKSILRDEEVWIDTDYGWVIQASELLEHIGRDPSWDWRFKRDI